MVQFVRFGLKHSCLGGKAAMLSPCDQFVRSGLKHLCLGGKAVMLSPWFSARSCIGVRQEIC